jgi:putative ABC transport system ATP-binding protein
MVRFENVSIVHPTPHGEVRSLDRLSLEVKPGEFVVLRGPSGCGKTTLLLTAGGMLRPTSGRVTVSGQDLYALSQRDRTRFRARNIGFIFQMFHLLPYLTARENVLLAATAVASPHPDRPWLMESLHVLVPRHRGHEPRRTPNIEHRTLNIEGSQFEVGSSMLDVGCSSRLMGRKMAARERARELLARLGLQPREHHQPAALSAGERQRTAIARALLNQPELILADEPTGNLDPENAAEVFRQLQGFHETGGTVIVVTHGADADAYADRVLEMRAGSIPC